MFGVGPLELLLILLVAVLVLGPEHLPKVMRTVTKLVSNYRRISTELQRNINLEANKEEYKQKYGQSELDEQPVKKKRKKKKVASKVETSESDVSTSPIEKTVEAEIPAPKDTLVDPTSNPAIDTPVTGESSPSAKENSTNNISVQGDRI